MTIFTIVSDACALGGSKPHRRFISCSDDDTNVGRRGRGCPEEGSVQAPAPLINLIIGVLTCSIFSSAKVAMDGPLADMYFGVATSRALGCQPSSTSSAVMASIREGVQSRNLLHIHFAVAAAFALGEEESLGQNMVDLPMAIVALQAVRVREREPVLHQTTRTFGDDGQHLVRWVCPHPVSILCE